MTANTKLMFGSLLIALLLLGALGLIENEDIDDSTNGNICPSGYRLKNALCLDIDECEERTDSCNNQRQICINTRGNFNCITVPDRYYFGLTTNASPKLSRQMTTNNFAINCPRGYRKSHTGFCVDINECIGKKYICNENQECLNTFGSHRCICRKGTNYNHPNLGCTDNERCDFNNNDCTPKRECLECTHKTDKTTTPEPEENTEYTNSDESPEVTTSYSTEVETFSPSSAESCEPGFSMDDEENCIDIDECVSGNNTCNPTSEVCENTEGDHRCICAPGYHKEDSSKECKKKHLEKTTACPPKRVADYCESGYELDPLGKECVDINECEVSAICGINEYCKNTCGHFICDCKQGYRMDRGRCIPNNDVISIQEPPPVSARRKCNYGTHSCNHEQPCDDEGSTCECPAGHIMTESGCEDVDECAEVELNECLEDSTCVNTIGSYRCDCNQGYVRSPTSQHHCMDVNECKTNNGTGPCHHNCINIWGSYRCTCDRGYTLGADKRSCHDIDECALGSSKLCFGQCHNTRGGYKCRCPRGYTEGRDKWTCIDVDECENGEKKCGPDEICHNIRGGARCVSVACPAGYNKEPHDNHRCRKATGCKLCDKTCMSTPDTISFNFISFTSNLPISTSPMQQVDLFTLTGSSTYDSILRFDLKLIYANSSIGIEAATENDFILSPFPRYAKISLVKSLAGPQDILLELSMKFYRQGRLYGSSKAKIFIFVSEYDF